MDFWTIEKIDTMMILAAEGKSMREIAQALGTSRNSVIGKYQRVKVKRGHVPVPKKRILEGMGSEAPLFGRDTVIKREYKPRRQIPGVSKDSVGFIMPALAAPPPRTGPAVGILDLTGCKWPVEYDPSLIGSYAFCNHTRRDEKSPYCAHHARVAVSDLPRTAPKSIGPLGLRFEKRAA
jgi:hypothetical protein